MQIKSTDKVRLRIFIELTFSHIVNKSVSNIELNIFLRLKFTHS